MLLQLEVSMRGCSGLIQSELLLLCTRTCTLEQVVWGDSFSRGQTFIKLALLDSTFL